MATFASLRAWLDQLNQSDPARAWQRNAQLGAGGAQQSDETIGRVFSLLPSLSGLTPNQQVAYQSYGIPSLRSGLEAALVSNPNLQAVDYLTPQRLQSWMDSLTPYQAGRRNLYTGTVFRG